VITTKRQTKKLVGRTITEVRLSRYRANSGRWVAEPTITLDDGTRLYFVTRELENDYAVEMGGVRDGKEA
jgi:hypothetical protein